MMQKGFVFLLLIWNSSPFTQGSTSDPLQFSLGCQAVIPCQDYRSDSSLLQWFYQNHKHNKEIKIFFQDDKGIDRYDQVFRGRMRVQRNGSLVISNFTDNDQGRYRCQHCLQGHYWSKQQTISVKKEILQETHNTSYVIAGTTFIYVCPGEFNDLKWTLRKIQSDLNTSNMSIHIGNVKSADAGEYTCWKRGCNGRWLKLLTINLCVITVHNFEDSSVSCSVMCGDNKLNRTYNMETGTQTFSVSVHPNGSLYCSVKQIFNENSTVNSTDGPSNADIPAEHEYLIPAAVGTPAAFTLLILIVLLICYLRPRLHAALPVPLCCRCLNGRMEEETVVVYSSVIIRKPLKTKDTQMTESCVYSEIKVERMIP